jgi:tetratricopeptide (TPR) repeat protein
MNLGSVLLTAGRLSEAVDQHQQAVSLKPTFIEARYRLGNAFLQMENLPAAKVQYESILRINPDYVQARSKLSELRAREHATESTP